MLYNPGFFVLINSALQSLLCLVFLCGKVGHSLSLKSDYETKQGCDRPASSYKMKKVGRRHP